MSFVADINVTQYVQVMFSKFDQLLYFQCTGKILLIIMIVMN